MISFTCGRSAGLVCALFFLMLLPYRITGASCRTSKDCNDNQICSIDFCDQSSGMCVTFPKDESNSSPCRTIATRTTEAALTAFFERTPLLLSQKLSIITVASTLLGEVHPYRRLHLNFLRVDPLVRLRSLRVKVMEQSVNPQQPKLPEIQFHQEVIKVFKSVDDIHSAYLTPFPLRLAVALIPITIREFYDDARKSGNPIPRFVLTDIGRGVQFGNSTLKRDVEIKTWNGVPINEAVRLSGDAGFGNNNDSKLINGLRRLTRRVLSSQLIPESVFVVIGFDTGNGSLQEVKVPWTFLLMSDQMASALSFFATQSINRTQETSLTKALSTWAVKSTFNLSGGAANATTPITASETIVPISSKVLELEAKIINSSSRAYGILKIRNFNPPNAGAYLDEYQSVLLSRLPKKGVVIDVRGNPGGSVGLCQFMVQLLTKKRLTPVELSLRTTPTTILIARAKGVDPRNGETATKIGDQFFARDRLFESLVNSYNGPRYNGSVIVLADAETSSCGDVFVSTVQDNEAASVIGVHNNTGGAGSTVFSDQALRFGAFLPLPFLPDGIQMSIAVDRLDRAKKRSGVPLEFFGATPDTRYYPTRRDQLEGDRDLLEFLGRRLREPRQERPSFPPPSQGLPRRFIPQPTI